MSNESSNTRVEEEITPMELDVEQLHPVGYPMSPRRRSRPVPIPGVWHGSGSNNWYTPLTGVPGDSQEDRWSDAEGETWFDQFDSLGIEGIPRTESEVLSERWRRSFRDWDAHLTRQENRLGLSEGSDQGWSRRSRDC